MEERRGRKEEERKEVFREGRKMGRKTALAPKYVSRLIFALSSQTLRVFGALAVLGGLGTTLRRPCRTSVVTW
ncbi:hypothetical protein BJX76DRAFT_339344 [Aspergillus varians]